MDILDGGYLGGNSERDEWLNHFTPPKTDYSVQAIFYEELLPNVPLSASGLGLTQFSFVADASPYFTDLSETKIEFKLKLTLANGNALPPAIPPSDPTVDPPVVPYYAAGFIQNPGASLFRDVEFRLNETLVSSMNGDYAIQSYISDLLFFNWETRNSSLEKSLWYDENNVNQSNPFVYDGFSVRYERTKESTQAQVQASVNVSLHNQSRLLLPMCKMNYIFYLNDPAFVINTHENNSQFTFEISDPRLIFKRVRLLPELQNKFEMSLSSKNALYPIYHFTTKKLTIGANMSSFSYQDIYSGGFVPKTIICGLISQTDLVGSFLDSSPFNFKPYGLMDLEFHINNSKFPTLPLQLNYDATPPQYMRGFQSLYQENFSNNGGWIDYKKYKNGGFCFYKINFNVDDSTGSFFSPPQIGSVRCNLRFSPTANNPLLVLVLMAVTEETIQV